VGNLAEVKAWPAWTRDAALAHIRHEAAGAFDPDVVRAFVEMIQDPEPAA
jgi:HD-GYP domain-containing protein (c-di-GMP phosphodiesterase class II)